MNKEQFSLSRSFTHLLSVDSNYPLLHAVRFVSLTVQMGAFFCIGVKLSDYLSTVYRLEFWLSVKMLNQALTSAFIFRLPQREWLVLWLLSSFSRKVHALVLILVWKGKCNKPCLPFKVNFLLLSVHVLFCFCDLRNILKSYINLFKLFTLHLSVRVSCVSAKFTFSSRPKAINSYVWQQSELW